MSHLSPLLKEAAQSAFKPEQLDVLAHRNAKNSSSISTCVCAALHYLCDPTTCEQALLVVSLGQQLHQEPEWPVKITVGTLKKQMHNGCRLCEIIYNGFIAGMTSSSLIHGTFTNIIENDSTVILVHDNCGTVSVKNSSAGLSNINIVLDFKPQRQFSFGCRAFTSCGMSASTASKEAVDHIWHWINQCDGHENCPDVFAATILPTRVLDVSQAPQIRLLETGGSMKGWYVTLSHCWGLSRPLETTRKSLRSMTEGIDFELLPPTFKHAIMVTQKLAATYIWIDSLCIIQDDARDWEIESANMHAIYANSFLTIAASHAKDSREGCFSMTQELTIDGYNSIQHDTGENSGIMVREARSLGHQTFNDRPFRNLGVFVDYLEQPLFYRGWVFQERLLSPRIVHFTKSELVWECDTTIRCQCKMIESDVGNANIKASLSKSFLNKADSETLISQWLRMVEEFSMRDLTYSSDRLPAMSGLAKRFSRGTPGLGPYLAGLWTEDLALSLIWRPATSKEDGRPAGTPYIAPTWSWASISGPVFFSCSDDLKLSPENRFHTPSVVIKESGCTPSTLDLTGKVSAGYIRATSLTVAAIAHYTHCSYLYSFPTEGVRWQISLPQLDKKLPFVPDADPFWGLSMEPKPIGTVDILLILWSRSLNDNISYVMVVRESALVPGAYERMGMKHMEFMHETKGEPNTTQLFGDAEERTVTIV